MPELVRDPVCGMTIDLRDAVASTVTEGRRRYFCCLRCHAAFLDTPHRFVGWAGDPADLPHAATVTGPRSHPQPCEVAA